ncbi:MAG: glycosyltransferase family 4 protein [Candidatus Pacebacteria bacterium]|nr:glycosyltransferase family 4 protein [Candidatus Paceibacterota bacterium]
MMKKRKAIFFDPYLETLGGGERYFLTLAACLARKKSWQVEIAWPSSSWRDEARVNFGLNFNRVNSVNINFHELQLLVKRRLLKKYDLCFWVSDGSLPWLFARKNILHFQVPFHQVEGRRMINRLKLKKINEIVCNSFFTKSFIDREFGVESSVIEPPVPVEMLKPGKKENLILSVGRFTNLLHHKRQDILVQAFKKMIDMGLKDWRLLLIGGDREGKDLVKKLRKAGRDYPIEIRTNLSFAELKQHYARARIFWTAAGFGVREKDSPEQVEHFGMTTVEAMAAGCVPVVIKKGGQREIVEDSLNGFLWQNRQELIKLTGDLISKPGLLAKMKTQAILKSRQYSQKSFCEKYEKIIF